MKKCLFFDYDETVFTNGRFKKETVDAMNRAQKAGYELILNSGRSRGCFPMEPSREAGILWDGYIFGGNDMEYHDIRFPHRSLTVHEATLWVKYMMQVRGSIHLQACRETYVYDFRKHEKPFSKEEKKKIYMNVKRQLRKDPLDKFYFFMPSGVIPVQVTNRITLIDCGFYYDGFQKGTGKGLAMEKFCRIIGADFSESVVFGDSMNDADMFRVSPRSVAMKCACDQLKEMATYVAETDFGVAEGIEHYVFGKR